MKTYLVILILIIALFLRLYRLDDLMPFIGDFAWFYISARDMLLTGEIPLVGITSSYTWVHQGPLWTYLLAIPLFISNFNPLSGGYFTAIIGTIAVFFIYKIGTQMFSKLVGIVAAALYATSPLAIIHARMPYHTSFIPLVTLLFFFFLYRWIKGDIRFLPFVLLTLGVLYNLELVTMVLWVLLLIILVYGIIKRRRWLTQALKPNIVALSYFLFLLVMLPMIIYDFKEQSGFYQTTAFFRLIKIYLFSQSQTFSFETLQNVLSSLFSYNQGLVFLANGMIAFLLTLFSFIYLILITSGFRHSEIPSPQPSPLGRGGGENSSPVGRGRKKSSLSPWERARVRVDSGQDRMTKSALLLVLWIAIPLCGIIISRTASEAYVPMFFPAIIISIALTFNFMYKRQATTAIIILVFVMTTNGYLVVAKNYLMGTAGGYGLQFSKRLSIAHEIVKKSKGREYNIIGKGKGSEHKSFTANYEYLTWWLGHPPSTEKGDIVFTIDEKEGRVYLNKND